MKLRAWQSLCVSAVLGMAVLGHSQSPPTQLVTEPIDETRLVTLHGNVHPLAQARFDRGAASGSLTTGRLLLLLNRPPEREAALAKFLAEAHRPGSGSYHKWLTPEEFGKRFGAADSDVQAVMGWLTSKGFSVHRVSKGKTAIEFSGSFAEVREA